MYVVKCFLVHKISGYRKGQHTTIKIDSKNVLYCLVYFINNFGVCVSHIGNIDNEDYILSLSMFIRTTLKE